MIAPPQLDCPQLQVADTRRALARLAALNRRRFDGPVVAVTGTAGKTTCKEMIASILRQRGPVLMTRGNRNNEIGLPLTLLELSAEHTAAVVEMGAGKSGDIAELVTIAEPDIALITNAGPAHLQGFGDLAGVVRGKGEILDGLTADGVAVLGCDHSGFADWRQRAGRRRVLSFGRDAGADVRLLSTAGNAIGQSLRLALSGESIELQLQLYGEHNAVNAAAAAAVAVALNLDVATIRRGLEAVKPSSGRMQLLRAADPAIIDDSYNANPLALDAALAVLGTCPRPRWLILGEMGELGAASENWHRRAAQQARAAGVDVLWCCGGAVAAAAAADFGESGRYFSDCEALIDSLAEAPDCAAVLIKGSRTQRMDRVVVALQAGCHNGSE